MRWAWAALLVGLVAPAGAEVVRCTDAAGRISYTDGSCPAGTRQAQRLPEVEVPPAPPAAEAPPPPLAAPAPPPVATRPPAPGDGLVILDGRGPAAPSPPELSVDGPYPAYPDGPGYYRGAAPPRDMRPRLRNCDATGCNDTLGNHYDRRGRIDRYTGPDGKTCRPVGSTTICR